MWIKQKLVLVSAAVCSGVLQCVAMCCSVDSNMMWMEQKLVVVSAVLVEFKAPSLSLWTLEVLFQCVLQCMYSVCCSVPSRRIPFRCGPQIFNYCVLQCVLQCVVLCVLQCVTVCRQGALSSPLAFQDSVAVCVAV